MKLLFIFFALNLGIILPQKKDPDKILDAVKEKFNRVEDYEVNVNIKVDVDFLKVPQTNAVIYYKQPGKIHFKSEGFALFPKEGMDFSPVGLLEEEYTAIYERTDTIENFRTDVIKIIPLTEKSDVVLTTMWIDESEHFIRRVESTPKTGGTFSIELYYENPKTIYPLPSQMIFTFNVERMNIPKGMTGEFNQEKSKESKKSATGKVFITYKNYKINKGIPDSLFEEKKEE